MSCTRCGNYTLFPPLCAQCEKDAQRVADRAARPAVPQRQSADVRAVAAKELGISVTALGKKLKKGEAKDYDALVRLAHSRDTNAARVRMAVKALIVVTVLYWGVRPLAQWFLR